MNEHGTQRQSLEATLAQEVECSRKLLACLDAERNALIARDVDTLETTVREKLDHAQTLERLEARREELVLALGYRNDGEGLQQCFRDQPRAERLSELWTRLLGNIEACRAGNLANGGILESGRQNVEQALCILRGQNGAPAVYAPDGEARASLGQRELGKV